VGAVAVTSFFLPQELSSYLFALQPFDSKLMILCQMCDSTISELLFPAKIYINQKILHIIAQVELLRH